MPISITALTRPRTITIPVGSEGDTLTITYNPAAFGPEMERREAELMDQGRRLEAMAQSLAAFIEDWDVVDEKGKPLKPTAENIGRLGLSVMAFIRDAIFEDLLPNR